MKLSDLAPKKVDFIVNEIPLTFRPYILRDAKKEEEIWGGSDLGEILRDIGSQDVNKILPAFDKFALAAWYQLDTESQRRIKNAPIIFVDPITGEEQSVEMTPLEKFKELFADESAQNEFYANFMRCRGYNVPDLKDAEAVKKWGDQLMTFLGSIGREYSE